MTELERLARNQANSYKPVGKPIHIVIDGTTYESWTVVAIAFSVPLATLRDRVIGKGLTAEQAVGLEPPPRGLIRFRPPRQIRNASLLQKNLVINLDGMVCMRKRKERLNPAPTREVRRMLIRRLEAPARAREK